METSKSYMICATPRTGSTLLCEGLSRTGVAGEPNEYLTNPDAWREQWGISSGNNYLAELVQRKSTDNGVFGIKVMMTTVLGSLKAKLSDSEPFRGRDLELYQIFSEAFPNLRYVWLTRRDKIRQAISWYLAGATNIWQWEEDKPPEFENVPEYDFEPLLANVRSIVYQESKWNEFFAEVDNVPISLVYEDLASDLEPSVRNVLSFLDIPISEPLFSRSGKMHRQRNAVSDEWYERFHVDLKETFRRK